MKAFIILIFWFGICSQLYGQERFSITLEDQTLIEAFQAIEENTPYRFTYVNELLPSISVSGTWINVSIDEFLEDLFESEKIDFSRDVNSITIYPTRNPFANFQIYGRITDGATGELLAGTNVYTNAFQGVISDQYGLYSIEIDPVRDSIVVFSYLGYKPKKIKMENLSDGRINVLLEAEYNVLEEVTITLETQKQRPCIPA